MVASGYCNEKFEGGWRERGRGGYEGRIGSWRGLNQMELAAGAMGEAAGAFLHVFSLFEEQTQQFALRNNKWL